MENFYTYANYEDAYCHQRWADCKKIGLYLLLKINDKWAKTLYKRLSKFTWDWQDSDEKKKEDAKLLLDVKIWIMINE